MENIIDIFMKLIALLLAVYLVIFLVNTAEDEYLKKTTSQIETYCTVTDKEKHSVYTGKVMVHRYTLDLLISDADREEKDTVTVTAAIYNDVEIGDEIKCIVFYKDEKLIKIEPVD